MAMSPTPSLAIALVDEYIGRPVCHEGAWFVDLAHALARRHDVTVLVDGAEEPDLFEGLDLRVRHPKRTHYASQPLRFARWAKRASSGMDLTISLTPFVHGDVDLRVAHGPLRPLSLAIRSLHPVRIGVECLHAPWALHGLVAMARSSWSPLTIGAREGDLGLVRPKDDDAALDRGAVRARLGLTDEAFVVLTSNRPGKAMTGLLKSAATKDATVIAVGERTHTATEDGHRQGARVIALSHTARMDALLRACDVCACTSPGPTMRLVAEAVGRGVPILVPRADVGAPALEMGVTPVDDWATALDRVVDGPTGHVLEIDDLVTLLTARDGPRTTMNGERARIALAHADHD